MTLSSTVIILILSRHRSPGATNTSSSTTKVGDQTVAKQHMNNDVNGCCSYIYLTVPETAAHTEGRRHVPGEEGVD